VSGLSDVGFRVFQTSENAAINPATCRTSPWNQSPRGWRRQLHLDGLGAECGTGHRPVDRLSQRTTTGDWYFTGSAGTVTGATRRRCARSRPRSRRSWTNNGTPASIYHGRGRQGPRQHSGTAPWMTCASTARSTTSSPTGSRDQRAIDPSGSAAHLPANSWARWAALTLRLIPVRALIEASSVQPVERGPSAESEPRPTPHRGRGREDAVQQRRRRSAPRPPQRRR
jgi:hypothetical protein